MLGTGGGFGDGERLTGRGGGGAGTEAGTEAGIETGGCATVGVVGVVGGSFCIFSNRDLREETDF